MGEALKAKIAPLAIAWAIKTKGTEADIFYPLAANSIYGQADNQYSYSETPTFSGRILLTGIQGERRISDASMDSFQEVPPEAWSASEDPWPTNTLIKVNRGSFYSHFRVDMIKVTIGVGRNLYRHYLLIPVEGRA